MSQWKLSVRRLHKLGGTANTGQLDDGRPHRATIGLRRAKLLGLVSGGGHAGESLSIWRITPLGEAWVEGRVVEAFNTIGRGVPMRMRATWLDSLPRGIRIKALS